MCELFSRQTRLLPILLPYSIPDEPCFLTNFIFYLSSLFSHDSDHGVCSYLESRASFGLSKRLTDIPPAKRLALIGKYKKPNKIDVTIGGLSEVPKEGSLLGPLYHASNVDQFTRLRDGDRFFYASKDFNFGTSFEWIKKHRPASAMYKLAQNALSGNVRLRDVLEANTGTKFPGKGSVMLM